MKKLLGSVSAIAVLFIACSSARATLFTVDVTDANGSHSQQTIASSSGTITDLGNGVQNWKGTVNQTGSYNLQWDLMLDADPSVSGSVALTNASAGTQTFTLNVSLPISPSPSPAGSNIFGSSAITVSDANGDAAATLNAPAGGAIYTAFINSPAVNQKTLFPVGVAPLPLTVSIPGGVNVASQTFSTGTTSAAASILGIQHSFTLTAGDSATMNSTFTITVPEPCTVALAAIGGLGLLVVRARRRK